MNDNGDNIETYGGMPVRTITTDVGTLLSRDMSLDSDCNADIVVPLPDGRDIRIELRFEHAMRVYMMHDREPVQMELKFNHGTFQTGIFQYHARSEKNPESIPLGFFVRDGSIKPYLDPKLEQRIKNHVTGVCQYNDTSVTYVGYPVSGRMNGAYPQITIQNKEVYFAPEIAAEEALILEGLLLDSVDKNAKAIIEQSKRLASSLLLPELSIGEKQPDGSFTFEKPEASNYSYDVKSDTVSMYLDLEKENPMCSVRVDESAVIVKAYYQKLNNVVLAAFLDDDTFSSIMYVRAVTLESQKSAVVGFRRDNIGLIFPYIQYPDESGTVPHSNADANDEDESVKTVGADFLNAFNLQHEFIFEEKNGVYSIIRTSTGAVTLQISDSGPVTTISDGSTEITANVHPILSEAQVYRDFIHAKNSHVTNSIQKSLEFISHMLGM